MQNTKQKQSIRREEVRPNGSDAGDEVRRPRDRIEVSFEVMDSVFSL